MTIGTAAAAAEVMGAPPTPALVLFDGGDLDAWAAAAGGPAVWRSRHGYLEVVPGAGDIVSRRAFGDFQLHLELWLPDTGAAGGQARANSGVYLQGRYELQILDSFGMEATDDGCGAVYRQTRPLWNACRKPEVWQTLDVAYRMARPSSAAGEAEPPRVTVLLNGILVHNNLSLAMPTAGATPGDPTEAGPIRLQDHGTPVRFRNIWIVPAGP